MAREQKTPTPEQVPHLLVHRSKANDDFSAQLKVGEALRDRQINELADLDAAKAERSRWQDYVVLMIKRFISPPEFAREFEYSSRGVYSMNPSPAQRVQYYRDDMKASINELKSIIERLPLMEELAGVAETLNSKPVVETSYVFIVHGHDEAAREKVARFVSRLGLEPIILHEQPNRGQTIIEKFEGHSSVGFAVVLLTPDDVGGKNESCLRPRARQNVIMELGYFCGILTRARVCALLKGDVEIPSDYFGVLYVPFDEADAWQFNLAREMKAAGLPVDLNKAYDSPKSKTAFS